MAKRKKRLEKGINSLQEQIKLHLEKRENAIKMGKTELAEYYYGEISRLKNTREKKQRQLDKR